MKNARTIILTMLISLGGILLFGESFAKPPEASNSLPAATQIAVCNIADILSNSLQAAELSEQLDALTKMYIAQSQSKADEIRRTEKTLQTYKENTPDYEEMIAKLRKMVIDMKASDELNEAIVKRRRLVLTRTLYANTIAAVKAVAQNRNIDIVLYSKHLQPPGQDIRSLLDGIDSAIVLYSAAEVDITEAVLEKLNADYHASQEK